MTKTRKKRSKTNAHSKGRFMNTVAKSTTSFLIPKGTFVIVNSNRPEPFMAKLPHPLMVANDDWYEVSECNCCDNLNFFYYDPVGRLNNVPLKEVAQIG